MVFSELTNNNTVTIYTKNEVNTYFVKRIESNDISIITCDNRIIELINTVKRLTKNSIGLQLNELFGNVFKTNI